MMLRTSRHRCDAWRTPSTPQARHAFSTLSLLCLVILTAPLSAQSTASVSGWVLDGGTREPIRTVRLRIEGLEATSSTDENGRFLLDSVPEGIRVLILDHLTYGTHRHFLNLRAGEPLEVEIRLTPEAIELEPLLVQTESARQRAARATGASVHVVNRDRIERALGTSRHLGDLVRQTVAGMHLSEPNSVTGRVCLEFRAAASLSLMGSGCRSPQVFLDGVPITGPDAFYGLIALETIQRIEIIPPGEAGARYGTGSLYGVLLIDTRTPGLREFDQPREVMLGPRRSRTFDWDQDSFGHRSKRSAAGAFLGNAVGLAAGLAIARRCISLDHKDELVATCGSSSTVGAGALAVVLPALGSALGARWGGTTDASRGDLVPMMLTTGLMIFPGYVFALSTATGSGNSVNSVGAVFLVIGVPAMATIGDYLFRKLRN